MGDINWFRRKYHVSMDYFGGREIDLTERNFYFSGFQYLAT